RLGTICLLINQGTCFVLFYSRKSGVLRGTAPLRGAGCPRSSSSLTRHRRWQVITDTRKGVDSIVRAPLQSLSDAYTRMPFQLHCIYYLTASSKPIEINVMENTRLSS